MATSSVRRICSSQLTRFVVKWISATISDSDFTLDFMMDERARELFYEAQRRTDLIRFGKYTSADYVWPWKGGVKRMMKK